MFRHRAAQDNVMIANLIFDLEQLMGNGLSLTLRGTEKDAEAVERLMEIFDDAETREEAVLRAVARLPGWIEASKRAHEELNALRNALNAVVNTTVRRGMAKLDAEVALAKAAKLVNADIFSAPRKPTGATEEGDRPPDVNIVSRFTFKEKE